MDKSDAPPSLKTVEIQTAKTALILMDFDKKSCTAARRAQCADAIPKDRKVALRFAFDKTTKDPAFLADANKRQIEINPVSGKEIDALMVNLYRSPPDVLAEARRAGETSQ